MHMIHQLFHNIFFLHSKFPGLSRKFPGPYLTQPAASWNIGPGNFSCKNPILCNNCIVYLQYKIKGTLSKVKPGMDVHTDTYMYSFDHYINLWVK
jgi:hypothetical protein